MIVIYKLLKAFAKKLEVVVPDSIKWGLDSWHGMAWQHLRVPGLR